MQNKAKFKKVKLNVNAVLTKDYENKDTWWSGKKQSQTKPNKANFTIPPIPKGLQQRLKNCLLKISCLMAQGFLCWGHGLFLLCIKKDFFGENVQ